MEEQMVLDMTGTQSVEELNSWFENGASICDVQAALDDIWPDEDNVELAQAVYELIE